MLKLFWAKSFDKLIMKLFRFLVAALNMFKPCDVTVCCSKAAGKQLQLIPRKCCHLLFAMWICRTPLWLDGKSRGEEDSEKKRRSFSASALQGVGATSCADPSCCFICRLCNPLCWRSHAMRRTAPLNAARPSGGGAPGLQGTGENCGAVYKSISTNRCVCKCVILQNCANVKLQKHLRSSEFRVQSSEFRALRETHHWQPPAIIGRVEITNCCSTCLVLQCRRSRQRRWMMDDGWWMLYLLHAALT